MCRIRHPDELRGHANAARPLRHVLPADRPFQHVIDPEFPADLAYSLIGVAILDGRGSGNHAQAGDAGEACGDLLGDPIREILVGR